MADKRILLEVFRYHPEDDGETVFQSYDVPYHEHWVVLDALNWIKDTVDGTLSYRWSCRMGVCGSCGMMVNGEPKLTCAAFLREHYPNPIRVEPLSYFPVERDLMINIDGFLDKLQSIKPWLIRDEERSLEEGEYLQTPGELARYKQYSMCINCMLCYSACPVVGADEDFIGPAVIALAQRYNLDSRDQGAAQRNQALSADEGAWGCTFVGECTKVCPKNVDPAGAIQQAKITNMKEWYKKLLLPWGQR
ncbi:MAG: succinate dehydrogenase/fumarate reductase iron-sulfur subunit [Planctomycetes bacterium]|nr:succinate dehydrogenase/fumarate reductase iron-sulfur subunit [Planctomycetota bacterium]